MYKLTVEGPKQKPKEEDQLEILISADGVFDRKAQHYLVIHLIETFCRTSDFDAFRHFLAGTFAERLLMDADQRKQITLDMGQLKRQNEVE